VKEVGGGAPDHGTCGTCGEGDGQRWRRSAGAHQTVGCVRKGTREDGRYGGGRWSHCFHVEPESSSSRFSPRSKSIIASDCGPCILEQP
jgi:hypothetical protein